MKKKNLLIIVALISPFAAVAQSKPNPHPDCVETWIAFLPLIIYVIILFVTLLKLKKDGTKLSDLLAEKDTDVSAAVLSSPPAPCTKSVSRFIAFLTGLVSLTIGVCITTFYMYCHFTNPDKAIDLSSLTTVIFGLGIGVLPYGFNKAASAMK